MSDGNDQTETKGRLSLRPAARGDAGHTVDAGSVRQSFSHGRSKVVQVEVRKKRGLGPAPGPAPATPAAPVPTLTLSTPAERPAAPPPPSQPQAAPAAVRPRSGTAPRALTPAEIATRQRVLSEQQRVAAQREAERREQETVEATTTESAPATPAAPVAGEPAQARPAPGTPAAVARETLQLKPGGRPSLRADEDDEAPRGVRRPSVGVAPKR